MKKLALIPLFCILFSAINAQERVYYPVSNFEELVTMEIDSQNAFTQLKFLALAGHMRLGLGSNNYLMTFVQSEFNPEDALFTSDGWMLESVYAVTRGDAVCTHNIYQYPEVNLPKGGDLNSQISGVCGEIATIHSALKLGLKKKSQVVKGKNLKEDAIKEVAKHKKKYKTGMTMKEIENAHKAVGAKECKMTKPIATNNAAALKKFTTDLFALMEEKTNPWDCSLGMESRLANKKLLMSHVEHITKMDFDKLSGSAEVTTMNGLTQGDRKKTVPANPGKNTWYLTPGGFPVGGMSDGATDKVYDSISNIVLTSVEYVCCRKKR